LGKVRGFGSEFGIRNNISDKHVGSKLYLGLPAHVGVCNMIYSVLRADMHIFGHMNRVNL